MLTLGGAVGLAVIAVVIGLVLIFTGDPQPCVSRAATVSQQANDALLARWAQFAADSANGPASVTIDESAATSRGVAYANEKDLPIENLQVYFCPDGTAEAKAKVTTAGISANVLIKGTLDTSGTTASIDVQSIKAGNLPSAIARPIVDQLLDRNGARTFDLGVRVTSITFADGSATFEGGP
jgi:hypothetical protein